MLSCLRGLVVVVAALVCASCAPPLMKLPSGPGAPAADGSDALAEATAACRAVTTMTAEIGVSGSVGGHRLRGRLLTGLAVPASARLEAVAPAGPPAFIFVARSKEATLVLPHDNRFLEHGRPDAVLDAVTGVPLDASDLRVVLTGCAVDGERRDVRQLGDDWRIATDAANDVYLHRDMPTAPWRLVAAVRKAANTPGWRAEYTDFQQGLPRTVRLAALDARRFDLRLALSQVEINTPLGNDVFSVQIPRGAEPITLDELRRSGPLADAR